jgi:predicted outer membrane repeat protein
MRRENLFALLVFDLIAITTINAQTTIPGGYVSGTWKASSSPYLIQGNITIHADSVLAIEPGVKVNFQGYYSLAVEGTLNAVGRSQDSIIFTAANIVTGWQGIRIGEGADSTRLDYCIIDHGINTGMSYGGGIFCASASQLLAIAYFQTTGLSEVEVYMLRSSMILARLESTIAYFTNNQAEQHGGGIWFQGAGTYPYKLSVRG